MKLLVPILILAAVAGVFLYFHYKDKKKDKVKSKLGTPLHVEPITKPLHVNPKVLLSEQTQSKVTTFQTSGMAFRSTGGASTSQQRKIPRKVVNVGGHVMVYY